MTDVDIDPFEQPVVTDETTDETLPLIPREGGGFEIDRSRVDETSFGGGDNTQNWWKRHMEKLKKDIRSVERHFSVKLTEEQLRNFSLDAQENLVYKKGDKIISITRKNGEIYSESTLERSLGSKTST